MKKLLASIVVLFVLVSQAQAAFVHTWGTDATDNLCGSIDLCSTDECYDATLSWEITSCGDTWKYCYTFDGEQDLSNLILEVTRDCELSIVFGNQDLDPQFWEYSGNLELPNGIYGVKFDDLNCNTICFYTDRAPVYGSVAAKAGRNLFYNCDDFIPRPDGGFTPVPEPATMAMLGLGVGVLGLSRRRRRRSEITEAADER